MDFCRLWHSMTEKQAEFDFIYTSLSHSDVMMDLYCLIQEGLCIRKTPLQLRQYWRSSRF
jgi:hypothetical protein